MHATDANQTGFCPIRWTLFFLILLPCFIESFVPHNRSVFCSSSRSVSAPTFVEAPLVTSSKIALEPHQLLPFEWLKYVRLWASFYSVVFWRRGYAYWRFRPFQFFRCQPVKGVCDAKPAIGSEWKTLDSTFSLLSLISHQFLFALPRNVKNDPIAFLAWIRRTSSLPTNLSFTTVDPWELIWGASGAILSDDGDEHGKGQSKIAHKPKLYEFFQTRSLT